jgi:eukaryotic-like serine/threonine-protein kinase
MNSSLLTGSYLGRYEIRSKIGEGGMGEVYLAEDSQLRRRVALKILPGDIAANQNRLRRFVQEAQAAAALNHPNIAHIYEIGEAGDKHFIAMEFVDGPTLRDCMQSWTLRLVEVLNFARQVADALSAAHAAGIVHRDIKPENIAVRTDGYVKVLGFGLAKLSETATPSLLRDSDASTLIHTEPGVAMGTVNYMSPEQARGLAVDARSDIFSLGVVVYEMVAARRPFEGATTSDLIVSILERTPKPLAHYAAEAPAELERIVTKGLEKEPEDRYQTIRDMAVDLRQLKRQLEAQLDRPTQPVTRSPAASTVDSGKQTTAERFQTMRMARLTNSGKASEAAISPDGKYVVQVIDDGGPQSLWVRQVAPSNSVQINPPAEVHYLGLTFSHDGDSLYYVVREKNNAHGALYQMPVLGGVVRKLMIGVDSLITLSPDGKHFAFVRNSYPSPIEETLMIADAGGGGETKLATRKRPDFFRNSGLAWSPDGKVIACVVRSSDTTNWHQYIVAVHVTNGTEKQISSQRWFEIERIAWLSDGSALLMNIKDQASLSDQIWQLSYPGGELRRITNDLNSYTSLSLTADTNTVVTVQTARISSIWTIKSEMEVSNAKQITSGTGKLDGWLGVCWTPGSRVVYSSNASGNFDLWIMEADATGQKQLTAGARNNLWPSVSLNGRYIVFVSDRTGSPHIWRMDLDGNDPQQLTSGSGEFNPSCSPDGRWVVYGSAGSAKRTLWKVSIDGGESVQLTEAYSETPVVSPDGKLIACSYQEASNAPWKIAVIPFAGGQPAKTFAVSPTVDLPAYICWTFNGQALTYVDTRDGDSNIWSQSIDGGPPKQLTDFRSNQIVCFGWSLDGEQLALAFGTVTSDVVLISGFR